MFKVGDKVIMVGWRNGWGSNNADEIFVGKIGVVVEIMPEGFSYPYKVDFDFRKGTYWYEDELKSVNDWKYLIEQANALKDMAIKLEALIIVACQKPEEKRELKVGDKVKLLPPLYWDEKLQKYYYNKTGFIISISEAPYDFKYCVNVPLECGLSSYSSYWRKEELELID